ncbi:PilW family protein [Vibrio campbellii]|uniref:PilW family protein n=1 Tax=Vibrio campbellii TaxID=680 RepID=UPI002109AC84|nr:prepilin-type N-terminal cleavage/methylation domain-containing protein [Vibrio campbellii]UTZ42332.1 prepilin-type N-terminal cleavage/methylation domain-containing protein [Vibrio campbellii]
MKVRGFTLMEMIVTIVIGSFIMLGIAGYVQLGMKGYADTIDRQRMQTQAQFVLEKMSREIRHAVPNSFRVPPDKPSCLQFVPIEFSGFYNLSDGNLEFLLGNDISSNTFPNGNWMVINPSRYYDLFPNGSESSAISQRIKLTDVKREAPGKPFVVEDAADDIDANSISSRHYIYKDNSQITYCFDNGQVTRQDATANSPVTVAESVDTAKSNMHYFEPTLQRGGIVHINLEFTQNGERSVYQQDVQVLNVP